MSSSQTFQIAVFPGDGIGHEITPPALELLRQVAKRVGGFDFEFRTMEAGAAAYKKWGVALSEACLHSAQEADAILLAAMGLPDIRYPDGTEIVPQIDLRIALQLYAGIRPIRSIPNVPSPLGDKRAKALDVVLVRESTEGLFHAMGQGRGTIVDDAYCDDTMRITRTGTSRVVEAAFTLARHRKAQGLPGRVTCVDKANVFSSLAFFRQVFDERAVENADIVADHAYVDAMATNLVMRPWDYDVMVMENMFGDILSDLGAGLVGGLGYAPSIDLGDEHAVFQPCHGTAPDIAGKGIANPTAMLLSAGLMLEWLGSKHGEDKAKEAGALIAAAVDQAFINGLITHENGGSDGVKEVTNAVSESLKTVTI